MSDRLDHRLRRLEQQAGFGGDCPEPVLVSIPDNGREPDADREPDPVCPYCGSRHVEIRVYDVGDEP